MKKISTPKLKQNSKTISKMNPQKSTIDFILGYAASYELTKVRKLKTSGYVLN